MRYEREVPLAVPAEAAWRVLSSLAPARGSAAGYEGLAIVEDADDDARVATLRLTGAAGAAGVAATAAVSVREGHLHVVADVRHGPGGLPIGEDAAEDALGHLTTTLAYALATASRPRRAWDTAVPPSPSPTTSWDAPSPPPAPPSRPPIPADATLETTIRPGEALPPAVIEPSSEVLTPRPRDIVHAGEEHPPEEHRRPWVRAGVAAAAGLAMLRILRSRR